MSPARSPNRTEVAAVRAFNRFYTRKLGVLDQHLLNSPFSLSEARVLYELAHREDAGRQGDRDRTRPRCRLPEPDRAELRRERADHPQAAARGPRQYRLSLTAKGRQAFARLERSSHDDVGGHARSARPDADRAKLVSADGNDRARCSATRRPAAPASCCASHRPGDMGWVVHEPRRLYAREYGWDISFEALVAEIAAQFIRPRSTPRASAAGSRRSTASRSARSSWSRHQRRGRQAAPAAGGAGRRADSASGARLVDECIALRARDAAIARSRCGPRASCSPRARSISDAGFVLRGDRAAPQFRPGPGRRDLGARAVEASSFQRCEDELSNCTEYRADLAHCRGLVLRTIPE